MQESDMTATGSRCLQIADVFEVIADAIPNEPALITNEVSFTFAELDDRITRLANHLLSLGIKRGEHVGIHAQNCHEWVESFYACAKIGAVSVNVNYRYVEAELRYLYDNADCVAVIAAPEYVAAIEDVRDALPNLRHLIVMGEQYEAALRDASPVRDFPGRSPDDTYILYTGGTTGMPKGVIWRHEDVIFGAMNSGRGNRPIERVEQLGEEAAASGFRPRLMSIGPMMHGGGQWIMGNAYTAGGCFVLYTKRNFDPLAVWQLVADGVVTSVSTIGDAMARPLAEALLVEPRPEFDLSLLFAIGNGGAPLSTGVRTQLREALPNVAILDSFGASETGAAGARSDDGSAMSAPKFTVGDDTTVLSEDGNVCAVGEVGKLARSGNIPLGYYKDPVKTAETFKTYDGKRWVIPGDFARIEEDGMISLLGRGSVCINSGGEKIYPEEVEAALKQHPAVFDAVVVGTPNERWGEQVTALVQVRLGMSVEAADVVAFSRTLVADYKSPKDVFFVDQVVRTPVGKADYQWAKSEAARLLNP
jgi:acyl-CoA synthetase (AMP-forming)/AMP-acid ligase II